jgi:uncharacterized YigZ family protein
MMECFNTISNGISAEQVIDKSRFIAIVAKVTNTAEVESHMQEAKLGFPNARHYVYAYRLFDGKLEKASDDGEPQGTGGRPILDILQHRQIWDAQIIVVRYFGGILLGTGGLSRAYGGTARLVLEKAGITRLVPTFIYRLQIPYSWYEQIRYGLKQKGWANDKEHFGENISSNVYIPEKETAMFEVWLDELTNKQVVWEKREIVMKAGL